MNSQHGVSQSCCSFRSVVQTHSRHRKSRTLWIPQPISAGAIRDSFNLQQWKVSVRLHSERVACAVMTDVMISATPMDDMRLSPSKDRLTFQIFPDPSDFERCCKLKDRLPSIVVEPTEDEVESGELRWPPEEFLVSEEEEDEEECDGNVQNGQMQNSQR
ncbi:LBH-like protein [Labeo rohita]|uniref:Protein LBH n=2 Tax=Labeo rohita TaxID=84645 RepID=A0A498MAK9_LABRO|nr:LBH-like protein [Labeo rohita]